MLNKNVVIVEQFYNSSPEEVWKAITNLSEMHKWYFRELESFKPETGFTTEFTMKFDDKVYPHIWEVTEAVPGKKIAYRWQYRGFAGDSVVSWELFPENSGTRLVLTHTGIETFPKDNPDFSYDSCSAGWNIIIRENLKKYLEEK
ncbi:MAG: SRPBCC domain-containing protein [Bacteroidetes bacterium]|nr:SRPBCC domain-containing protein [Bacteroidota bacterium]